MFDHSKVEIKKRLESYNETKIRIILEPINKPILTMAEFKHILKLGFESNLMEISVYNAVNEIFNNWKTETVFNKVVAMNVFNWLTR
jgi:hypothetical protein